MKIIILGSGRVGSRLAKLLDMDGHEVTVVDRNPDQFRRLGPDFRGDSVVGTGIDEDVLRTAGIENADVFVAVTNGDNTNVMAAQIAQVIFKVPKVITRIYDPIREDVYHDMGLDTICPTTIISNMIRDDIAEETE
jgi:trk system potassium uptake protein